MAVAGPLDEAARMVVHGFQPETALELRLAADPVLQYGWAWGDPRPGHPEGAVGEHVAWMLRHIADAHPLRRELRLVALLHDSFKFQVDPDLGYSPENDHARLARRFAERYVGDERILATLEWHDEPYWIWRHGADEAALADVLARLPDVELMRAFVQLDASTPGKDPAFLWWFRRAVRRAQPARAA
jgi:hypothetical protein